MSVPFKSLPTSAKSKADPLAMGPLTPCAVPAPGFVFSASLQVPWVKGVWFLPNTPTKVPSIKQHSTWVKCVDSWTLKFRKYTSFGPGAPLVPALHFYIYLFIYLPPELSEAQQKLLIKSMEKKILPMQLKLVRENCRCQEGLGGSQLEPMERYRLSLTIDCPGEPLL